jgi:hypothetical protein
MEMTRDSVEFRGELTAPSNGNPPVASFASGK